MIKQLREDVFQQRDDFAVRMQMIFEDSPNVIVLINDGARFHREQTNLSVSVPSTTWPSS